MSKHKKSNHPTNPSNRKTHETMGMPCKTNPRKPRRSSKMEM